MPIAVGQPAPDFTLKDQSQKEIKLSDFAGKRNVVLIFYPLDFSPICTNEHACFVNDLKQFEKLDAQVLGLSVDSVWAHKAFAEKIAWFKNYDIPVVPDMKEVGQALSGVK